MRFNLLSLRDLLVSFGPFTLLTVALLVGAYWWLQPNPPKRVVLATGPEQSAYETFGERYREALAEHGIEVVLLPSEGSSDNLMRLRTAEADIGFVQGGSGMVEREDQGVLQTLGSLFVEPLWLFYREDAAQRINRADGVATLPELAGWRVNVGTEGSGVPQLFERLLQANNLDPARLQLSHLPQTPGTVAFLEGEVDALVFASAPESVMVQIVDSPYKLSQWGVRTFTWTGFMLKAQGSADIQRG